MYVKASYNIKVRDLPFFFFFLNYFGLRLDFSVFYDMGLHVCI